MIENNLDEKIIDLEWNMFSQVSNIGGPASCQLNPKEFRIMRKSQIATWPEQLLSSYLEDLMLAKKQNRNLMTEKYARMMQSTFPEEYKKIENALPPLDKAILPLIDEIVATNIAWKKELSQQYPKLNHKGRPIFTKEDTPYATSVETYLRGELQTYSPKSIKILHAHTMQQKNSGINGVELTLLNQVKLQGFTSLEQAEKQ